MRRVFVFGCQRAGTTLVQSLLAAHSAFTSFTESHFFSKGFYSLGPNGYRARGRLADLVDTFLHDNGFTPEEVGPLPRRDFWVSSDPRGAAKELLLLLDRCTMRQGVSGWVEKTPNHVFRIPLLEQVADSPRFVHIIRRPEGVLPSLHKASLEWGRMKTWTECAVNWVWALKVSEAYFGNPAHYIIAYERLVQDPSAHMKRLIQWLGMGWEEAILDNYRREAMHLTIRQEVWKSSNLGDISNKNRFSLSALPPVARSIVRSFKSYERLDRALQAR